MATDHPRLAKYVQNRRLELGLARKRAAELAGMSKDTWRRIEEGGKVQPMSYAKAEPVLGWATGSCTSILEGKEPIPSRQSGHSGSVTISERPREDLDGEVRETIQLAMIATTNNLTAEQIRELSDRALRDLKAKKLI